MHALLVVLCVRDAVSKQAMGIALINPWRTCASVTVALCACVSAALIYYLLDILRASVSWLLSLHFSYNGFVA